MAGTGEGVGHEDIYERNVLDRGNSKYKGLRADVRHSEVACRMAGRPDPRGPISMKGMFWTEGTASIKA